MDEQAVSAKAAAQAAAASAAFSRQATAENRDSQPDSDEEESEILEESPCGRWLKRREEVEQRNIPGVDATYLAMDTDEGVEVVWAEIYLSNWDPKLSKEREDQIKHELDRLLQLDHPNLVKLHKYWTDIREDKARVIIITEYMSSGSLKQFLKKTKRNTIRMGLAAWKRWCTQMLSALCYLHSSYPPIIHGNLTCDTVFISHNGLIKINAIAPNIIHRTLKSVREDTPANMHYVAPEIGIYREESSFYVAPVPAPLSPAIDVFSFGICALEMAALEIAPNHENDVIITKDQVYRTINALDNPQQRDFIRACLSQLPSRRPSARKLLFHPVIFEVPSLRLLSAHVIVSTPSYQPEQLTEEALNRPLDSRPPDTVLAQIPGSADGQRPPVAIFASEAPRREMEKFFEEVRNGAYPLTALMPSSKPPIISRPRNTSIFELPESPDSSDSLQEEEHRRLATVQCTSKNDCIVQALGSPHTNDRSAIALVLRLDDKMNRQVSCELRSGDTPKALVEELLNHGLIHSDDRVIVASAIEESLAAARNREENNHGEIIEISSSVLL